jgi:nitrate reductase molybdenum cofactor assembly chaperone NarJ/NarW
MTVISATGQPVAAKAASLLLRYPDDDVLAALPTVKAGVATLPDRLATPLSLVERHRAQTEPTRLAAEYVELFDLRRRCCLHLSYYTAGDTRQRGEALLRFASVYRQAGLLVGDGELPDYLPAVLELAARAGEPGWELLRQHRVGLDLLGQALERERSVYRHAIDAVRAMLPAPTASDLARAADLVRSGPPREEVGLQPFALSPGGRR